VGSRTVILSPTKVEQAALAWLFSLADQERGVGWNPRASPEEQWKLGRTRALLDLAGAPDRRLRIALVAGTKGKGSTCAMLASILGAAGVRCGLYTKPHLQTYRERIRIDGRAVDPGQFAQAVERMRAVVRNLPPEAGEPTTFEVTTAMALEVFAREGCEMAVVEVGLGGRLDATNATDPFLSVITSISYDHTAILGSTLGAIAAEKAGIMRPGRAVFVAEQRAAAMAALRRACRTVGSRCEVVPPLAHDVALLGSHQRQNAALAIAAARAMAESADDAAIERGLARVRWPGRFEVFGRAPPVVLDGAHNGASAEALAATLQAYAPGRRIIVVVGINRDKDARAVLKPLLGVARSVWATQARDNPRALDAHSLGRLCRSLGADVQVETDLVAALAAATGSRGGGRRDRAEGVGIVCVTGSLMLVGQARVALGLPAPERLW
jgi:dihydrofolate synthase / folylpolyglutamate synthase